MTKRVFSNSAMVAHVWAQRTQDSGRSANMYFEGGTIYSYGSHFPLATFIETTQGATFPIGHGKRAFPLIKAAIGKGWHRNGHTIHLGHFQLDSIDIDGTVKAGCHTVPYSAIEDIAAELGLV